MRSSLLLAFCLLVLPVAGVADDNQERFEQLVDEVLEVTGALEIGEQMSAMVVGQMMQALRAGGSQIPDGTLAVIEAEVQATIREEIESGSFHKLMYPVYARHLSEGDLVAMLAFYATPEGKKVAAAMPAMASEGMVAGQQWGVTLGPKIAARVQQRLAEEGIEFR